MDYLVNAYFDKGQKKKGVKYGCDELKDLFTNKKLIEIHDENYEQLYNTLKMIPNYILLGGDHSIGQSSVASSIYKIDDVKNLYVIWIDAHGDINTYTSSITKNLHGMPLSGIVGYEKPWFNIKENLPLSNLLYFGIRDLDQFEKEKIESDNIFFTSNTEIILSNKKAKFHISFDVDSLDPTFLDSTGCVVEHGLHPDDIITVINTIYNTMIALDIVEYNPLLGDNIKSKKTMKYIIKKLKL